MKILVFEYITGGGLNKQALPESLLQEGRLMLDALLADFKQLTVLPQYAEISVLVMLDARLIDQINSHGFDVVVVGDGQDCDAEFKHYTQKCDAVWPVAPEFDHILYKLCVSVEQAKKHLLTSSSQAVALTGNKFASYLHFKKQQINTVPTRLFKPNAEDTSAQLNSLLYELTTEHGACVELCDEPWIIKPIAGVGCMESYVVSTLDNFKHLTKSNEEYIIQPHINGEKLSLSCLFKAGEAWLLSVNEQYFTLQHQQYHLDSISVNVLSDYQGYTALISQIAQAIPDLWGYVGIDLIKTPTHILVLEINPRLTTSFVGLQDALGINVLQNILELLDGEATLIITKQETISLKVSDASTN